MSDSHGGARPNSGRKIKCLCGSHSCKTCNNPRSAYRRRHPEFTVRPYGNNKPAVTREITELKNRHGWD